MKGLGACAVLFATIMSWAGTATLPARDVSAIRNVLEHYRTSWLSNNADGVRENFTQDAVLMPHHGLQPVVGMKAISEFWFPPTSAKTTILKFVQTVDEVGGHDIVAYVRGRSEVAWKVEDNGKTENWGNAGNYMAIFEKQADGKWLISHLIWDDPPNQRK